MSLAEIQKEAAALSVEERIKLAAFLTSLRMKDGGEWERAMREMPAERAGWVSLEEAKQRLLGGD